MHGGGSPPYRRRLLLDRRHALPALAAHEADALLPPREQVLPPAPPVLLTNLVHTVDQHQPRPPPCPLPHLHRPTPSPSLSVQPKLTPPETEKSSHLAKKKKKVQGLGSKRGTPFNSRGGGFATAWVCESDTFQATPTFPSPPPTLPPLSHHATPPAHLLRSQLWTSRVDRTRSPM